jgi:Glycosyl hydrolase family 47
VSRCRRTAHLFFARIHTLMRMRMLMRSGQTPRSAGRTIEMNCFTWQWIWLTVCCLPSRLRLAFRTCSAEARCVGTQFTEWSSFSLELSNDRSLELLNCFSLELCTLLLCIFRYFRVVAHTHTHTTHARMHFCTAIQCTLTFTCPHLSLSLSLRSVSSFGTVNLRYGVPHRETPITCVAGAGTFTLEFGMLTRLTGDIKYDLAARRAVRGIHHRQSRLGLLGNHINSTDGAWTIHSATIGTAVDSYYEYLVKGSILFGDHEYQR